MKKLIRVVLCLGLLLMGFGFWGGQLSITDALTQSIGVNIAKWVLDEPSGHIYAISQETNQLLSIRTSDLQVEHQLTLTGPTDIEMANQKLYIALSASKQIAVVDAPTQVLEKTLITTDTPYAIAVDDQKLFYVTNYNLYVVNIVDGTETKLSNYYLHYSDITIDTANHILYAGESGTSGGDAYAINTADYTLASKTTYLDGYGFSNPAKSVIVEGANLFYASRNFVKNDLADINGVYPNNVWNGEYHEAVLYVKGNYVFFSDAVYDRDKFVEITKLPVTASQICMDSLDNVYLFDSQTKSIRKEVLNLTLDTTMHHQYGTNHVQLDKNIYDWIYDPGTDHIYAISQTSNKLLYIRAGDLVVEGEKYIGSLPSDIDLYNGNLYIALWGANKFAITGTDINSPVNVVKLPLNPYNIAVIQDKMYFTEEDQGCRFGAYNLQTQQLVFLRDRNQYYEPALIADRQNNLLYIGDSGISSTTVDALNVSTDSVLYTVELPLYAKRKFVIKDNCIYYAGKRMTTNLTVLGQYHNASGSTAETFNVDGNKVFSEDVINDRDTYQLIASLPYKVSLAATTGYGINVLYNNSTRTISKYNTIQEIYTPSYLTVDASSYTMYTGATHYTRVTANWSDGRVEDVTYTATYQTADPNIATVDSGGWVRGVSKGVTTITVSYRGIQATVQVTVEPRAWLITTTPEFISVYAGLTVNLSVTAKYTDNSTADVTNDAVYTSSNPAVATVSSTGVVKGLKNGSATITVVYKDLSDTCSVWVNPPRLTGISLDSNTYAVAAGCTKNAKVTALYTDDSTRDVTGNATYQVADTQIATVSTAGVIRGLKVGATTLTASYSGYTATADIQVQPPVLMRISSPFPSYATPKGRSVNVQVHAEYSDNSYTNVTNMASYQIADTQIATVNSTGLVTGLAEGTTTLTMTYQGFATTTQIVVQPPVFDYITIDSYVYSLPVGSGHQTIVTAHYSDGGISDVTGTSTYQVSDTQIATVNSTGLVTGVNIGETVLTVTYQSYSSTVHITIVPKPKLTFADGFDSGEFTYGGWVNNGCDVQYTYSYSGFYACAFNSTDTLTKTLSTSGFTNIQVSYARMTVNLKASQHLYVEWYDGSNWNLVDDIKGTVGWSVITWSLPAGANNNPNFKLRFRTAAGSTSFIYLDDVKINGDPL